MTLSTDAIVALLRQAAQKEVAHESGSHDYCESASCRRNWKIAFAVILFLEGLLFGYFALILRRFACLSTKRFRNLLHFVNAGGGGVFLTTGLLHILPEAAALLEPAEPDALAAAEAAAVEPLPADPHAAEGGHGHEPAFPTAYAIVLLTYFVFLFFDRVLFPSSHAHPTAKLASWQASPLDEDEVDGEDDEENGNQSDSSGYVASTLHGIGSPSFVSALLCVLGLSAHSLFESVALGSSSRFTTALHAFIAIAAHRWATSMALGSILAKHELSTSAYSLLTVLFAFIAPLGVFIGFAVQTASDTFQGVVFALSAGTFLYIGAFETVSSEFVEHPKHLLGKFCVMASGAAVMVAITGILVIADVH